MGSKTAVSPLPCTQGCSPRAAQPCPLPWLGHRSHTVWQLQPCPACQDGHPCACSGGSQARRDRGAPGGQGTGGEPAGGGQGTEPRRKVPSLDVSQYLGLQHGGWELNWSQLWSRPALSRGKGAAGAGGCWGTSPCRAGHPPARTSTLQKARAETPPPAPQRGHLSLPAPRWGKAPPTCVCCEVPAVGLALASSRGRGRRSLDLVQLLLLGRNRKPSADHTAIARFPVLPPLPASPCAWGQRWYTAPP